MLADKCEGLNMVDLIGDLCIPSELIIPQIPTDGSRTPRLSGALFMSGAKLFFLAAGQPVLITSA